MNRRDQVIELSAKISALRSELAAAESQLDSFLASPNGGPVQAQDAIKSNHAPQGPIDNSGGLTDGMLTVLATAPPGGLNAEGIAARLGATNLDSIRSGLARLTVEQRIERVSRGYYKGREIRTM